MFGEKQATLDCATNLLCVIFYFLFFVHELLAAPPLSVTGWELNQTDCGVQDLRKDASSRGPGYLPASANMICFNKLHQKKKGILKYMYLWRKCWEFVLLVSAWVLAGFSSFLPQSRVQDRVGTRVKSVLVIVSPCRYSSSANHLFPKAVAA